MTTGLGTTPSLVPQEQDIYKIVSVIRWLLQKKTARDQRVILSADQPYYVDVTNGSDANNGVSTGTAFKTIGKALSTLYSIDGRTFNVTIQVLAGTYNETATFSEPPLTSGIV